MSTVAEEPVNEPALPSRSQVPVRRLASVTDIAHRLRMPQTRVSWAEADAQCLEAAAEIDLLRERAEKAERMEYLLSVQLDTARATTTGGAVDRLDAHPAARWYCLSRDGVATLCVDEEDAQANAATSDQAWPAGGPHCAVQLVQASEARDPHRGGASYEASMLRNLLARIHRDGGHYVEEHGMDKALEDAEAKVVEWLTMQERLADRTEIGQR